MAAVMLETLEEHCLWELLIFGDTVIDCLVKLGLDTVHTGSAPSVSSKWKHF